MVPQSGPSLLPVAAATPQQRAVELVCCGDTGVQAAQESAPPPTAHGVAGCNPFDVPPQTGPRVGLDFEGLHGCGEEGSQGTPGGENTSILHVWTNTFISLCLYTYKNYRKKCPHM